MGKKEIRLSGTGGQGIILAGILLGEAAILDGREVVQTQSYGPEARGGASKAEVIISDSPILYPKVIVPCCLLIMSQEAAAKYAGSITENGVVVYDNSIISELPATKAKVKGIPLTRLAREEIGNIMTTNIISLGALAAADSLVSIESLETAVGERLGRLAELNIRALRLGWEWGLK